MKITLKQKTLEDLLAGRTVSIEAVELALEDIGVLAILDVIDKVFLLAPEWCTTAEYDLELLPWILGVHHSNPVEAGDFLKALAEAALRADPQNYRLLRPVVAAMKRKYPKYGAAR